MTRHVGDESQCGDLVDGLDRQAVGRRHCRHGDVNRGAHARPSERCPLSPGRPGNPEPCSGTNAIGATTSGDPVVGGIVNAAAVAASIPVSADRRAPVDEHPTAHGRVDDEAGVVAAEVDEPAGGHQPLLAPSVRPLMNCRCRIR